MGYADNGSLPLGSNTAFMGQNVDGTTILVRYTVWGDLNLDGLADDNDVTVQGASYNRGAQPFWSHGDLDFDGDVDDSDVTILGATYNELFDIDLNATSSTK